MKKQNFKSKTQKSSIFRMISKATSGIVTVLVCVLLLSGCGANYDADTNTVFVEEDGKIVTVDVEAFDESTYSEDDLKSYIQESIDLYNQENADSIKQKKLSVKENTATLVLEFANQTVYEDFYGTELFTGTIAQAQENGYAFDVEFAKLSDGKVSLCEADEILSTEEELKVVIIKSNTNVKVDGEILYVSAQNIAGIETNTVSIKDGSHISNLEIYEGNSTQETQGTESTEITQTTENEGSVGEDELLITTEQEEVEFDFGEEERTESPLSEVYTYIIYK